MIARRWSPIYAEVQFCGGCFGVGGVYKNAKKLEYSKGRGLTRIAACFLVWVERGLVALRFSGVTPI